MVKSPSVEFNDHCKSNVHVIAKNFVKIKHKILWKQRWVCKQTNANRVVFYFSHTLISWKAISISVGVGGLILVWKKPFHIHS